MQETTGEGVVLRPGGPVPPLGDALRLAGHPAHRLRRAAAGARARATARRGTRTRRSRATWSSSPAAGRRTAAEPPDANPGTFYSALSNVDLEIGAGNPGAVGVRARYAQHCFTSHVRVPDRLGPRRASTRAATWPRTSASSGGEYGIWTGTPSPGWQYTLLDARFEGQRRAAIREQAAGLTLIRPQFRDVPTAIEIEAGRPDDLFVKDARFENVSGPAVIVSLEESPRTADQHGERRLPRRRDVRALPGERAAARGARRDLRREDVLARPALRGPRRARARRRPCSTRRRSPRCRRPSPSDLAPLPPGDTWVNARALGARGDGATDDTAALQKAIDAHRTVYLPMGKYVVTDTLRLRPDSVLVGLHPSATQLVCRTARRPSRASGGRSRSSRRRRAARTIVIGVGLYTNGINPRAVAAKWMAGRALDDERRALPGRPRDRRASTAGARTRTTTPTRPTPTSTAAGTASTRASGSPTAAAARSSTSGRRARSRRRACWCRTRQTSGRVYQMSSEHHVRHEVQLHGVANWELHALQTEEERGESGFALPLEIRDSSRITISNLHVYRVISSDQPFPWAVKLTNSKDVRFRNVHCYSNSKVAFDATVFDDGLGRRAAPARVRLARRVGRARRRPPRRAVPRCSSRGPRSSGWRAASTTSRAAPSARAATSTSSTRAGSGSIAGPWRERRADDGRGRAAPAGEPRLRHGRQPARRVVRGERHGLRARSRARRAASRAARRRSRRPRGRASPRSSPWATGGCSGRGRRAAAAHRTTTSRPTAARSSRRRRASSTAPRAGASRAATSSAPSACSARGRASAST